MVENKERGKRGERDQAFTRASVPPGSSAPRLPLAIPVFIGLGSNLGDRKENLTRALEHLRIVPGVRVLGVSTYVDTKPLGILDQPDYLNAVAAIETTLEPVALLDQLLHIELRLGRVRRERWGPRIIDLDILTYGDQTLDHPRLKIPHPELNNRPFLLEGIKELSVIRNN